jgi:hypothetical protein
MNNLLHSPPPIVYLCSSFLVCPQDGQIANQEYLLYRKRKSSKTKRDFFLARNVYCNYRLKGGAPQEQD